MPKKKIVTHKGKPKQSAEENDDPIFRKNASDNEEEYTTVVEFEENKKYNKRLIENNWAKYESSIAVELDDDEGKEYPKTDDFNFLLKTASSDCSHFQFSSEKQWQSENNSVPSSKIFNLDLNILSSGLACVPFYKRMGLDESELSVEDKERFDKEANNSLKEYNLLREKLAKKSETDSKDKHLEGDSKSLEESFKDKLNLEENNQGIEKKEDDSVPGAEGNKSKKVDIFTDKYLDNDKVPKSKEKIFFSENENLEDWLDSVLDD